MKDIIKVMKFDFLTIKPVVLSEFIIILFFGFLLSLLFSPLICAYIMFVSMTFVISLQGIADKNHFNRLYGILPVKRKNITRARFLYIFLVHFLTELFEILFAVLSMSLKLYRIFPNQNSEMMLMVQKGFKNPLLTFSVIIGIFSFLCIIFTYMEMIGQIFGRENEFKILIITLGIISLILIFLTTNTILPVIQLPKFPESTSGRIAFAFIINLIVFLISIIFGEITAHKLSGREL